MTAETFFSNFGHLADAPNGMKKLRELILQLAVQGKLVPQDPNDEPASVLLERIEAEKDRLVKEGKIKKQKSFPVITDAEKPFDLPSGWDFVRLGVITNRIGSGSTPRGGRNAYVSSGFPFLRSQNILNDGLKLHDVAYIAEETHKKMSNTVVFPGDILLNITGASLGRCTIFPDGIGEANVSQHVTIIRPTKDSMKSYLHLCVLSPYMQALVWGRQVGMAREGLSKKVLELFEIPLPPLKEQKRIVAKVDQLMALCDELEERQKKQQQGRVRLNAAALDALLTAREPAESTDHWQRICSNFDLLYDHPETITKLRAAILQLAVQGKLVPQDPNDEPASDLLERIRHERKKLVASGRASKEKGLLAVSPSAIDFEIPRGWEIVRFDWVCDSRLGKMLDKNKNRGELRPYLRNTNVQWLRFELDDLKLMRFEDNELSEFQVKFGDLLVCEGGEPGRCAIWLDRDETIFFQKALHRIRPFSGVNHWFLLYRLWGSAQSDELSRYFTGATIKHLTGKNLRMLPLGLPPKEEQERIVAKVDQLMALCDELEGKLDQARQHSEKTMVAAVRQLSVA